MFGIYSYTATIVIFLGGAYLFSLLRRMFLSTGVRSLPKGDRKALLLTFALSIVLTAPAEWAALSWRAWVYDPAHSLHTVVFGAEIETYLFAALTSLLISYVTLKSARREDRKRNADTNAHSAPVDLANLNAK